MVRMVDKHGNDFSIPGTMGNFTFTDTTPSTFGFAPDEALILSNTVGDGQFALGAGGEAVFIGSSTAFAFASRTGGYAQRWAMIVSSGMMVFFDVAGGTTRFHSDGGTGNFGIDFKQGAFPPIPLNKLDINGRFGRKAALTFGANYTVTDEGLAIVDTSGGTITLPSASDVAQNLDGSNNNSIGAVICVKNSSGGNTTVVDPGGLLIDGAANLVIAAGHAATFQAYNDGSNPAFWVVIAKA